MAAGRRRLETESSEMKDLSVYRNIGIFAHVDAGGFVVQANQNDVAHGSMITIDSAASAGDVICLSMVAAHMAVKVPW